MTENNISIAIEKVLCIKELLEAVVRLSGTLF